MKFKSSPFDLVTQTEGSIPAVRSPAAQSKTEVSMTFDLANKEDTSPLKTRPLERDSFEARPLQNGPFEVPNSPLFASSRIRTFCTEAPNYRSSFALLAPQFGLVYREHLWLPEWSHEIDTLGPYWACVFFPWPTHNFYFEHQNQMIPLHQGMAGFFPPFSIFGSRIARGPLHWMAYFSDAPLESDLPSVPVLFPWSTKDLVQTPQALFQLIRQERNHYRPLDIRKTAAPRALKIKQWIDQYFQSDLSFQTLEDHLQTSQTVLGREFRKCYGLTPSDYRKKLRTNAAMISLVLKGESVTEVGLKMGYCDLDHFTKQFRSNILAKPSQFKPPASFYDLSRIPELDQS